MSQLVIDKKQRFQIGFETLFQSAACSGSSIMAVLVASIGALVQKYSGPDAISVPMEVVIRYGETTEKFELLNAVFDFPPSTGLGECIKKIEEQLLKNPIANNFSKQVPSLWIPVNTDTKASREDTQSMLEKLASQAASPFDSKSKSVESEPSLVLSSSVTNYEDWVRVLILQKVGAEAPINWELNIRTSGESFTNDNEILAIISPGVKPQNMFTPLGNYRPATVLDAVTAVPGASLNIELRTVPLNPIEKGDPRLRASTHLQNMWASVSSISKESLNKASLIPVNLLSWIPPKEEAVLLDHFSSVSSFEEYRKSVPLDPNERLVDIFSATVAKYPNNIAITSPEEKIKYTYTEFDEMSTQLAHALKNAGVTGGNVGMMLPRSAMMYIAIMGILKAGAAYVPIDPEYPSDRVAFIVSDSDAHLLLTNSKLSIFASTANTVKSSFANPDLPTETELIGLSDSLRDLLPPFTGKVWAMDVLMKGPFSKLSKVVFPCPAVSSDLAYIIYTSGSTGRPKGVMLEHRNVCALVRAERHFYNSLPTDVTWQGFSIAFDASVEELWLAWSGGGALFCATHAMIHAGPELADIWAEHKVSIVSTVPTLLTMLEDVNLEHLRILILGGEACHRDLILKWSKGRRMINTYGPTEATVIATGVDCKISNPIVTIGKAIPHYSAYIVCPTTLRVVPRGVPGELLIGGPGLARGYVKRDELTQTVFIENPWKRPQTEDPPRLYRTGDLTRWSEQGEIEFMGRIDAQVKLRGYRVELAEIESVILQSNSISTCVCHVMTVSGAQQLVAFIVPKGISIPSAAEPNTADLLPPLLTTKEEQELKELLRIRLPPYMVPSIFETLNVIPTLPSGKANRKQLYSPAPRVRKAAPIIPAASASTSKSSVPSEPVASSVDKSVPTPNNDLPPITGAENNRTSVSSCIVS